MIRYLIPISGLKTSTNKIYAGQHWAKRKEFADSVFEYANTFCRPIKWVVKYPVQIRYRFFFISKPLDTTNCTYLVKCFEDALCALGILEEDDSAHVARTVIEVIKLSREKKKAAVFGVRPPVDTENEDHVEIIIESYVNQRKNRLE